MRWARIVVVAALAAATGAATYSVREPIGDGDRDDVVDDGPAAVADPPTAIPAPFPFAGRFAHTTGTHWFWAAQPHCTPAEVEDYIAAYPPEPDINGVAFAAACEALAGRVDLARAAIDSVAADRRDDAASPTVEVAWAMAHVDPTDPALRELVPMLVEDEPRWPRVEYLAGAVAYVQGDRDARLYLAAFRAAAAGDGDRSYLPVADELMDELASPPRPCGLPIGVDPDGLRFFAFGCPR